MTKEDFYFPPPFPSGFPLVLTLAGVSYCDGTYLIRRADDPMGVLEYVAQGEGTLEIGDGVWHPRAGDVYIVPPYTTHRYYSSKNNPWVKYWFNLRGELLIAMLYQFNLAGGGVVSGFSHPELFVGNLAKLRETPAADCPRLVTGFVGEILSQCALLQHEHGKLSAVETALKTCLDNHLRLPTPELAELGGEVDLSAARVLQVFKKRFGISPVQYLLGRKMELAADLLRQSALSVKEIAGQLGFADQYYFSAMFKRKLGVSPLHYRQRGK